MWAPLPPLRHLLFFSAALLLLYFLLSPPPPAAFSAVPASFSAPTTARHLIFGIASTPSSFPRRQSYLSTWNIPNLTNTHIFLPTTNFTKRPLHLHLHVSSPSAHLPYTFPSGLPSAVRVSRVILDLLPHAPPDTRWLILADDDTVFIIPNLIDVLSHYDADGWWYVGGRSESVEQNVKHSFAMAFGGGAIAVSYPLAKVLGKVMDGCLARYGHLYGSDDRLYACLTELGVGFTEEKGFHQVDVRGDVFGMLSTHPLAPLVSLHHLDYIDPLFPGMNRTAALEHLFEAVKVDPGRVLQQTVCYDRAKSRTISVSWGYAVQIFEGNQLLPDILSLQKTFRPWKRSRDVSSSLYMFNTREFPRDPCKRPAVFFLESVSSVKNGSKSIYRRHLSGNCTQKPSSNLQQIRVHSQKLGREIGQVRRRHCCDVLPSSSETYLKIHVRKCRDTELIAMHQ